MHPAEMIESIIVQIFKNITIYADMLNSESGAFISYKNEKKINTMSAQL